MKQGGTTEKFVLVNRNLFLYNRKVIQNYKKTVDEHTFHMIHLNYMKGGLVYENI